MEKSHVPRGKEAWEQVISRLGVSIEYQVLIAHTGVPVQDDQNGGTLTVREKPQKKGCEEIKSISSQPLFTVYDTGSTMCFFCKAVSFSKGKSSSASSRVTGLSSGSPPAR